MFLVGMEETFFFCMYSLNQIHSFPALKREGGGRQSHSLYGQQIGAYCHGLVGRLGKGCRAAVGVEGQKEMMGPRCS